MIYQDLEDVNSDWVEPAGAIVNSGLISYQAPKSKRCKDFLSLAGSQVSFLPQRMSLSQKKSFSFESDSVELNFLLLSLQTIVFETKENLFSAICFFFFKNERERECLRGGGEERNREREIVEKNDTEEESMEGRERVRGEERATERGVERE